MSFRDDEIPSASLEAAAAPGLSCMARTSYSEMALTTWPQETVVPPPEHNAMRPRSDTEPYLGSVYIQPDQTDNEDSTSVYIQPDQDSVYIGHLTMKESGLPEVVTAPETITIYEACGLMSVRGANAVVLTDSNGLLSGILTNKDIISRVIAAGIDYVHTPASKVMTKNPIFVSSIAHPLEALQKIVQGDVTKVPIIENGEVIGIVGLAKCLFDLSNIRISETSDEQQDLYMSALRMLTRWNQWQCRDVGYVDTNIVNFQNSIYTKLLKHILNIRGLQEEDGKPRLLA